MFFNFQNDWPQFKGGCNWYTFRLCLVEVEWDRILGGLEVTVVILGLGLRVRHTYAETELARDLKEQVEGIENGTIETKPWPGLKGMLDSSEKDDKIEGLEADLDAAVEMAFHRGAEDWVRLNYPELFKRLSKA